MKTVTETCYRTVTETACREVCETVCVPRTETRQVTRECGEWVCQQYYVPGKTICCNGQLVQCPGQWCTKKVWCARTVVENVCCTVYERETVRNPTAGFTCVLANDYAGLCGGAAEVVTEGAADEKHAFPCEREISSDAADAVGSKKLAGF